MTRTDAAALARLRILNLLGEEIGRAVQELYLQVASRPDAGFHFPTGRRAAELAGYPSEALEGVPADVLARFAGVACPIDVAAFRPGERVLDLGCGGGTDLFIAAKKVGPQGRVVGVDLTPAMVASTRAAIEREGVENAEVLEARAPHIPDVPGGPVDVVTSNGSFNLIPEKEATLRRLYGLLKPGGRLVFSDIALTRPPAAACLRDAKLWAECLVGAFTEESYLQALHDAGFEEVQVHSRRDYFSESPSAATRKTAEDLGGFAWVVSARRP